MIENKEIAKTDRIFKAFFFKKLPINIPLSHLKAPQCISKKVI